jgi:hypothetical protein
MLGSRAVGGSGRLGCARPGYRVRAAAGGTRAEAPLSATPGPVPRTDQSRAILGDGSVRVSCFADGPEAAILESSECPRRGENCQEIATNVQSGVLRGCGLATILHFTFPEGGCRPPGSPANRGAVSPRTPRDRGRDWLVICRQRHFQVEQ